MSYVVIVSPSYCISSMYWYIWRRESEIHYIYIYCRRSCAWSWSRSWDRGILNNILWNCRIVSWSGTAWHPWHYRGLRRCSTRICWSIGNSRKASCRECSHNDSWCFCSCNGIIRSEKPVLLSGNYSVLKCAWYIWNYPLLTHIIERIVIKLPQL